MDPQAVWPTRTTVAPGIQRLEYEDGTIRYKYRFKNNGHSHSETFPNKKAAVDRKREVENAKAGGGVVVGRKDRLRPFSTFAQDWLDSLAGNRKKSTIANLISIYRRHLEPRFSSRAIGSINQRDARKLRTELVTAGLNVATIKHVINVFRNICELAVDDGVLATNPIPTSKKLNGNGHGDVEKFQHHPLSAAEVAGLSMHIGARYPIYGLVIRFTAYTGLRAAELAGLEIGDLDLTPGREEVRVQRAKRQLNGWMTTSLKTTKSGREVPLADWLADDLRAYLATHPRRDDPTAPLFPARYPRSARGIPTAWKLPATIDNPAINESYNWNLPCDPDTLYFSYLKPALAALDLPVSRSAKESPTGKSERGVRFHDLRHTFAVLNLSAGVHFMQVSKWLGHEKYTTTLNVYSDYIPEEKIRVTLPRPARLAAVS